MDTRSITVEEKLSISLHSLPEYQFNSNFPLLDRCAAAQPQPVSPPEKMKVLILGGSGFVSGAVVAEALQAGYEVTIVTRGQRPIPAGVKSLLADRRQRGALEAALPPGNNYDLVVDCIGYLPEDARQDIRLFASRCARLVFISSDFVFEPDKRHFPQPECNCHFLEDDSYGANKRRCELEFFRAAEHFSQWTILRPCHIYGPGSKLGCLPKHGRDPELINRIRRGEELELVGAGKFLQQPIFARDLAKIILCCPAAPLSAAQIYQCAGPDIVESVQYYQIIADLLGCELKVKEIPVLEYLAAHPEHLSFLCHRIYDLHKLRSGRLPVPSTSLCQGLKQHVAALLH